MASSSCNALRLFTRCRPHVAWERLNLKRRGPSQRRTRGGYTAARRPVRLVYAEQHRSKPEALERERQIKRWSAQKKELLVRGDTAHLSGLSQKARVRTGFSWKDLVELSRQRSRERCTPRSSGDFL
jgi:predicted GIY-YIG superfamily endonuclease